MNMTKILPLAAAAIMLSGSIAMAKTVLLSGNFVAENGTTSDPSGSVVAKLNTVTDMLTYKITYSGLSGPVKAAHFHGPAPMGADAGVLVPIPGPYDSGMLGKVKVTAETKKDLIAGMTYVNLHTKMEPDGEARAQMGVLQK